jgi:hypothetical protein
MHLYLNSVRIGCESKNEIQIVVCLNEYIPHAHNLLANLGSI